MRRQNAPRLLDMPVEQADEFKATRRNAVLLALLAGRSEDEIYRRRIDVAIEAARLEGCDDAEEEVIASQARRDVAQVLAEFRGPRDAAEWRADVLAARGMANGTTKGGPDRG